MIEVNNDFTGAGFERFESLIIALQEVRDEAENLVTLEQGIKRKNLELLDILKENLSVLNECLRNVESNFRLVSLMAEAQDE